MHHHFINKNQSDKAWTNYNDGWSMQLKKEIWLSKEWLSKKQKNRNDPNWSPVFSDDQNYLCMFPKGGKISEEEEKKNGQTQKHPKYSTLSRKSMTKKSIITTQFLFSSNCIFLWLVINHKLTNDLFTITIQSLTIKSFGSWCSISFILATIINDSGVIL